MPQAGERDPKDPYDARNPGVKPYGKYGWSDSDLQREENERRGDRWKGLRGVAKAQSSNSTPGRMGATGGVHAHKISNYTRTTKLRHKRPVSYKEPK